MRKIKTTLNINEENNFTVVGDTIEKSNSDSLFQAWKDHTFGVMGNRVTDLSVKNLLSTKIKQIPGFITKENTTLLKTIMEAWKYILQR